MASYQASLAAKILRDCLAGKLEPYFQRLIQQTQGSPKLHALLEQCLRSHVQRQDYCVQRQLQGLFLQELRERGEFASPDLSRLVSSSIATLGNVEPHTIVACSDSDDFGQLQVHEPKWDADYVYGVAPVVGLPWKTTHHAPVRQLFFLDEMAPRVAYKAKGQVLISGHCLWRRLEDGHDHSVQRFQLVRQYWP